MVFSYGFMRKQSTGTSCTEPLDATLTPECPRAERMSSALANHANSLGGLCESGGCAERVAVPQPAAQRWTVLLWPLPVKLEVKLFHGRNEWLRRYFCSSEMHQSLGATKNGTNQNFCLLLCWHWQALCRRQAKSSNILASVVLYSQRVRARADKQQAAEWNRSVSLCTPTQGSFLAFQTAAGN